MTQPRRPGLLAVAALALCGWASLAAADTELDALADEILAEHYDEDGPGAAVAVLQDGEVVIQTSIGLADVKRGVPIDADTLFDLASVSKQFTAAAILLLEADGRLDVRRPLTTYLPDFRVRSPGRPVRVEDLVLHVSGLEDYTDGDDWGLSDREFAELTTEGHLQLINQTDAQSAPGRQYIYNNSGYVLLALVVERTSGQSFAEFATRRLFQPAGMRATRITDRLGKRFAHQARGYKTSDDGGVRLSESPSSVTGDGNVYSSTTDMIAWMRALDGNRVLSAAQKRRAFAPGKLDSGAYIDSEGSGYGYGWSIDGDGRVSHSGSWMGTATYVARNHAAGVSVIVLSNDEGSDVERIAEELAQLVE